jgi:2-oxoglutarate dehydrogenase complex dehydrogenase (E1) component-like enzyme
VEQNGIVLLLPHGYEGQGAEHRQEEWSAIYNFVQDKICLLVSKLPTFSLVEKANENEVP